MVNAMHSSRIELNLPVARLVLGYWRVWVVMMGWTDYLTDLNAWITDHSWHAADIHHSKYKLLCPRGTQTCALAVANIKVNGNGKVILDTHPESDQHQNWTYSRGSPPAPTHQIWWWSMNPFLRYLADKKMRTDRQTDRHADDHKTLRPTARR